jgi:hypothetical protein
MRSRKLYSWISLIVLVSMILACGGLGGGGDTVKLGPDQEPAIEAGPESEGEEAETETVALTEGSVSLNTLFFRIEANGAASGGTTEAVVSVKPAAEQDQLRVGFFEEEVSGIGQMWHSSGWMAVTLASMLLGIDARDYEFSFSTGGRIDGPSAGGLMTVGVLAALRGDEVDGDAAMTGTINPDGTIGPVGGIPHKVQGAADAGFKLVLIPAGQRYDYDQNAQQSVDVVEVGQGRGVEVREVSTIFEAYEILTGEPLPRPQVSGGTPQLPTKAFDRMKAKAQEWYARYTDQRNQYDSLSAEVKELFIDGVWEADDMAAKADNALGQGLAAVAYQRAWNAATLMEIYVQGGEIVEKYINEGLDSVISQLNAASAASAEMDAVVQLLGTEEPKTISDQMALIDAYTNVSIGQGLLLIGDATLQNVIDYYDQMEEEDIVGGLTEAALYYMLARSYTQLARDSMDISYGFGTAPLADPERVAAVSETLRRAAESNLSYFESVTVDQYAQYWGVHPDVAEAEFLDFETDYLLAVASTSGTQALASGAEGTASADPIILGNSMGTYARSAGLIAKYYSLEAEVDENGDVVAIGRERALADMLDLADQRAKELIGLNGDDVPVPAVLYYENARMLRQGPPSDQLEALKGYWAASSMASVQAYLSGHLEEPG